MTTYTAHDLTIDVSDSTVRIGDGRGTALGMRRLAVVLRRGDLTYSTWVCGGPGPGTCLVTFIVDGATAGNRVAVARPGLLTVYHLRLEVARR
jgi:hypothetical protein